MVSTILDCFAKLVKDNERGRLDAGAALLGHVARNNMEEIAGNESNRALIRLVRGLGSSRNVSKKSFYATLTAYLKTNPETRVEDLFNIMEKELRPVNSNAKSENADIYMGRILLCGAILRSDLSDARGSEEQQKIFKVLNDAGRRKSYLSFVSAYFLVDFLNRSTQESLKDGAWPLLKEELGKPWKDQTLDTFYILLTTRDKFSNLVDDAFLKEHLGHEDIFHAECSADLLKLLTNVPQISCHRHPIYKLFCEKIVSSEHLLEFWRGVDECFVKPSRSIEYLGLEMLKHILTNIKDKSHVPSLLVPNFLQHMIRRFEGRKINRRDEIAIEFKSLLGQLLSVTKGAKNKTRVRVLKKLILYPGDLMIEKITGTKVVQMLTVSMTAEGVKKVSKLYREMASNERRKERKDDVMEPWTNSERIYIVQLLTRLLGHLAVNTEHEWRLDQLKFLFHLGLCESPSIGTELALQFKDSFYRALDHKLPKLSDLHEVLSGLIRHLNVELFENGSGVLRSSLNEASIDAWKSMIKFIGNLETDTRNKHAILVFYTMDLHMGLQLFNDSEMAVSAINEIHDCSARLNVVRTKKNEAKNRDDDEEPEWVDVIVDLLLSFLSRNSHLLRSMVGCVFPHLCPVMTATSIHRILSVLDPKAEENPLVSKDDETSEDSESSDSGGMSDDNSDENDENAENDERVDRSKKKKVSSRTKGAKVNVSKDDENEEENDEEVDDEESDDEDASESESDFDEEVDVDETITERLRLAVRQALSNGNAGKKNNVGDEGVEEEEEEEDIDVDRIDEERGRRLDESLAAAFRILRENRRGRSKKQEKSAQALTHFRVRVIDLLEAYIDSGSSMALAVDMLVPLFSLLEFCIKDPHQKPLESRVRMCLKKLSSVKKFRDADNNFVDAQTLTDVLKLLMEKGEKSTAVCQEMGDKLAECATFLLRCAQHAGLPPDTLVPIYVESLTAFFKKRDCVLPAGLFKNALQILWPGNWHLVPLLVDFAFDDTIRSFRRSQALEFLTIFYRNNRLVKGEERNDSVRLRMEKKLCANSAKLLKEAAVSLMRVANDDTTSETKAPPAGPVVKQKFVCLLMTLLHAVHPKHLAKAWKWNSIVDAMVEYRRRASLANDAKTAYNRLALQIGAPTNVERERANEKKMKNSADRSSTNGSDSQRTNGDDAEVSAASSESETEEKSSETKKSRKDLKKRMKARSKRSDKQKLKKEARELRAKAMSEGLEYVRFSEAASIENGGNDEGDEVNENEAMEEGCSKVNEKISLTSKTKRKRRSPENDPTMIAPSIAKRTKRP